MGKELVPVDRPARDDLHPAVYGAVIALTAWFVVSVWALFSGDYASMDDLVITVFFVVLVTIPVVIWRVWRRNYNEAEVEGTHDPLRHWAAHDFQSWTGRQKGSQAMVEILLPIVAVAFGITVFGIVFQIVAHSVAT